MTPYAYSYPTSAHSRRHGPTGYKDYESYRAWLRDEFSFRCVFCLFRERWGYGRALWDIDHLIPQARDPNLALVYDNLLYVCRSCNSTKSFHLVPDPSNLAFGSSLKINEDGTIVALNRDGQLLVQVLRLDNQDYTRFRRLIIQTLKSLLDNDPPTFQDWMSYPEDMPNLASLRPLGNTRPAGLNDSFFERRARGELPEIY